MFGISKRAFPVLSKCRAFSTDITQISITQSIPQISSQPQLVVLPDRSSVKITKLENGLTVASQHKFGMHCTIGAMVKAGPRYENGSVNGVSHFIEKLGFHSSNAFKDRDAIQAKMETCNAIFDCQIARDFVVYACSGVSQNSEALVNILSETVLRPKITDAEVETAGRAIGFELASLEMSPPVDPLLTELLHSSAYHADNTLGLPRYCPKENIPRIDRRAIMQFMASYYRPERLVLVGVGVDHDEFLKQVESHFLPWETSYNKEIPDSDRLQCDDSTPLYYGGEMTVDRDLSQYHAPMPEFAHCAIGMEGCGTKDEQFVTSCLLNSLLGGGGSFSAGGPGKGMYTRLYTNILNQCHWVNSAQAFNHSYADAGIFTVTGSAEPKNLQNLIRVIIEELRYTAESTLEPSELQRAKNQLESMLLMNLEMNAVAFEDIARQVLGTGEWKSPAYWVERINAVTAQDLQNLLQRMFKSRVTLVGYGRMECWPAYQDMLQQLSAPLNSQRNSYNRMPSFFKRFC